jgi:hypothetical protein
MVLSLTTLGRRGSRPVLELWGDKERLKTRCPVIVLLLLFLNFVFMSQADLEFMILLPQSPKCWITGVYHRAWLFYDSSLAISHFVEKGILSLVRLLFRS